MIGLILTAMHCIFKQCIVVTAAELAGVTLDHCSDISRDGGLFVLL